MIVKNMLLYLRPLVRDVIPSAATISRRLVPERAQQERKNSLFALKEELKKGVSLGNYNINQGMVTDGSKNASSKNILAVVVKANDTRLLFDSIEEGARHDALSEATAHEALFKRVKEQLKDVSDKPIIRYLTTDSGGGIARARKILALRHPDIIFMGCQAHQIVFLN
jgi:hypothetical protein